MCHGNFSGYYYYYFFKIVKLYIFLLLTEAQRPLIERTLSLSLSLSFLSSLLSFFICLAVFCLWQRSTLSFLLFTVYCLLFTIYCLLFTVYCLHVYLIGTCYFSSFIYLFFGNFVFGCIKNFVDLNSTTYNRKTRGVIWCVSWNYVGCFPLSIRSPFLVNFMHNTKFSSTSIKKNVF